MPKNLQIKISQKYIISPLLFHNLFQNGQTVLFQRQKVFAIKRRESDIMNFQKVNEVRKKRISYITLDKRRKYKDILREFKRQESSCLYQSIHCFIFFAFVYNNSMNFSNFQYSIYPQSFAIMNSLFPYSYQTYLIHPQSAPQSIIKEEPLSEEVQDYCFSETKKIAAVEEGVRSLHSEGDSHRKTHWSSEQDKLLEKLVEVQKLEWKEIPKHFPQRTQNMCYSRYRRIAMSTRDKVWTRADQELVIDYVQRVGQKWKLISNSLQKFTPKQIRERYLNYLRPNIIKQDFSLQEDLAIVRYVLVQGKHWRKMEDILPGRPQGAIKGRYYGKLQKVVMTVLGKKYSS